MGKNEEKDMRLWQPIVSAVLLVAGVTLDSVDVSWPGGERVRLVFYAAAFFPVGWGVMREAAENAFCGDVFNEFMLMSVAAIGAFAIGEYPEAVAVMLLYRIGETLQDRAVDRARENIKSMMEFRPDHAWVVTREATVRRNPEDVAVGDVIEVKPGERVPLDGVLLSQDADFDTAALTGESVPRTIGEGEDVMAGMISLGRVARVRVTRPVGESAVSRILRMVEDAAGRKAPTELFIRRFARVYTPVVFAMAVMVVLVPWVFFLSGVGGEYVFSRWFGRALVFLVIACPCALVISVPLGYFAGIGAASRRGILFKGGGSLDAIAKVDTVAFDKTGTLTTGRFAVIRVAGLEDGDVAVVAAIERASGHPVARAIVEYADGKGLSADAPEVKSVAGYGLEAGGWLVGAVRLLDRHGVDVPDSLRAVGDTVVAVAMDGRYKGCIVLSDTPKDDARVAIEMLGQRTVVLSGDRQGIVDKVALQLGVDEGYGDLLPQDKAEHIGRLRREGRRVAFVGDGINDAPVLALSDVGIAMGAGGADMAVETADVVIRNDKPSKVAEAISIGRRTRRIVGQNIAMSIGVKVVVMALGVAGVANIWIAVFADTGMALLAVLNSMRIFSVRKS